MKIILIITIMCLTFGVANSQFSFNSYSRFLWFWGDDAWSVQSKTPTTTPAPVYLPETCGKRLGNRIVGGTDSQDWPWAVSLLTTRGQHFCGGSIITKKHILTAAHCAYRFRNVPALHIGLGGHLRDSHRRVFVSKIFIHNEYNHGYRFDGDVAILKLEEEIDIDLKASPICLPEMNQKHKEGDSVRVKGWGRLNETNSEIPNHLQEVSLKIKSPNICSQVYGRMFTENMMCVGGTVPDKDACQGDSGGPLVLEDEETKKWIQVGVVSFGMGCGRVGFPGVYTKLVNYVEWIEEQLQH